MSRNRNIHLNLLDDLKLKAYEIGLKAFRNSHTIKQRCPFFNSEFNLLLENVEKNFLLYFELSKSFYEGFNSIKDVIDVKKVS